MKVKMFIQMDKETFDLIQQKSPIGFQLNCTARYDNGQINVVSHLANCRYEDSTNVEIIMSTEDEDLSEML